MIYQQISKSGINAGTMKRIAIIAMFIDHMTLCFLEVARDSQGHMIMNTFAAGKTLDSIGRGIGRLAFPVFCFLIVEGFLYTKNRWKYLLRLLVFAAVSQVPFCLLVFPRSQRRHADTIFTLAAGYILIWIVETLAGYFKVNDFLPARRSRYIEADEGYEGDKRAVLTLPARLDRKWVRAVLFLIPSMAAGFGICWLAKWFGFDYSYGGVICILLLYLLYRYREYSIGAAWAWLTNYNHNELLAITGFWLIWCYNGKRGKQNKYFFYLFYPGHLILLYLIRKAIFGT